MDKSIINKEVLNIIWQCENIANSIAEEDLSIQEKIKDRINSLSASHCGSWLGYQSCIYYKNFRTIPPGCHFDAEWGFTQAYGNKTNGEWVEYNFDKIKTFVFSGYLNFDKKIEETYRKINIEVNEIKNHFDTILEILIDSTNKQFFKNIKEKLEQIKTFYSQSEFVKLHMPSKQFITRDSLALSQGILAPPHIQIESWFLSLISPFNANRKIIELVNKTHKYMNINFLDVEISNNSNKIFIGHGRSPIWRELKDFIESRLSLKWEEFNSQPVPGLTTMERLQEMLNNSSFAFLILTAEDEHNDKTLHARENVIHEVGLFQGRLGFRKAIIVLEEGCAEFSNIIGLSQIRFPKGNIGAKFEEIRRVLEREGLIK